MADYRPVVKHRTEEVILLNVKVACPAGWWMPLHSNKKYWTLSKRIRPAFKNLKRWDTIPPRN